MRHLAISAFSALLLLAAAPGDTIDIAADGAQADAALTALVKLVEGKFGED